MKLIKVDRRVYDDFLYRVASDISLPPLYPILSSNSMQIEHKLKNTIVAKREIDGTGFWIASDKKDEAI